MSNIQEREQLLDIWFGKLRKLQNVEVQDQFGNVYIVTRFDEFCIMPIVVRPSKVIEPNASWRGESDYLSDWGEYWLYCDQDYLESKTTISDNLVTAEDLTPTDSTKVELWNEYIKYAKEQVRCLETS